MDRDALAHYADAAWALDRPPPSSFDVLDVVTASPTADDVAAASLMLQGLESELAGMPDKLRYIAYVAEELSYVFVASEADADDQVTYWAAAEHINGVRDDWLGYQALLADQVGHLRAQIAIMEHDIAWQAYVADNFGATDIPRRSDDLGLLFGAADTQDARRPAAQPT